MISELPDNTTKVYMTYDGHAVPYLGENHSAAYLHVDSDDTTEGSSATTHALIYMPSTKIKLSTLKKKYPAYTNVIACNDCYTFLTNTANQQNDVQLLGTNTQWYQQALLKYNNQQTPTKGISLKSNKINQPSEFKRVSISETDEYAKLFHEVIIYLIDEQYYSSLDHISHTPKSNIAGLACTKTNTSLIQYINNPLKAFIPSYWSTDGWCLPDFNHDKTIKSLYSNILDSFNWSLYNACIDESEQLNDDLLSTDLWNTLQMLKKQDRNNQYNKILQKIEHQTAVTSAENVDYLNIKAIVAMQYCQVLQEDKMQYRMQAEGDDSQPSQKPVRSIVRADVRVRNKSPTRRSAFTK